MLKTIREVFFALIVGLMFVLIVGLIFVALVGQYCALQTKATSPTVVIHYEPIPSAREIQQRLKDLDDPRYDPGPIDGIPGPRMTTGWDNYICDRYAKRAIEGR